jgi:subtilisin-like proprotein convertase family protein
VIPDGGFALDTIPVTRSGRIQSMKVSINITHPLVNDLVITLRQNSTSKNITLIRRPTTPDNSVCYGDDIAVTLADSASVPVNSSCSNFDVPAISDEKRPYMLLVVYNGEQMNGNWELEVRDEQKQFNEFARLNTWCLQFQYTP